MAASPRGGGSKTQGADCPLEASILARPVVRTTARRQGRRAPQVGAAGPGAAGPGAKGARRRREAARCYSGNGWRTNRLESGGSSRQGITVGPGRGGVAEPAAWPAGGEGPGGSSPAAVPKAGGELVRGGCRPSLCAQRSHLTPLVLRRTGTFLLPSPLGTRFCSSRLAFIVKRGGYYFSYFCLKTNGWSLIQCKSLQHFWF